jgi:hypothetical protein
MKPVSQSMYMVPQTTPLAAGGEPPAPGHAQDGEKASRACRWCGKPLVNPRRNQECCNAECREAWERSKAARRKQSAAGKPKGHCLWCDGAFDQVRQGQEFCCTEHQGVMIMRNILFPVVLLAGLVQIAAPAEASEVTPLVDLGFFPRPIPSSLCRSPACNLKVVLISN